MLFHIHNISLFSEYVCARMARVLSECVGCNAALNSIVFISAISAWCGRNVRTGIRTHGDYLRVLARQGNASLHNDLRRLWRLFHPCPCGLMYRNQFPLGWWVHLLCQDPLSESTSRSPRPFPPPPPPDYDRIIPILFCFSEITMYDLQNQLPLRLITELMDSLREYS